MFQPRDFIRDKRADVAEALDRLAESLPGLSAQVLFECTSSGALLDANSRYFDIEYGAGCSRGELAKRLVAALAPGGETTTASFLLELFGNPRHFHVRFAPVSTRGRNKLKLVGTMREAAVGIDEARDKASAGWQDDELVRVNSDWYWETNARGLLTSVSRSLELLLGKSAGGLLGRPLSAIGTLLHGDNGELPIELASKNGSSFRDQLMSIDTAGGAKLYRLAGVAVWDRDGAGNGYRGVAAVVPNSAKLIERMRGEIGRTAKQHFLSTMSHELRTPLNAIIGFAEAMNHEVHGPLKPQYVDYANDIATAGRHLLGLIQDLLDISSLDSGSVALDNDRFDLAEVVDQARTMLTMKAKAKNIDLRSVELACPVTVHADRRRTLQILANLLTNAVKFTSEGGMVGCELEPAANAGAVSVAIFDTGPGIASENHARVFEKFEQLPSAPDVASGDGTGLGLHISRRLATLMGGDLTLASTLGEGARFTLTLPAGN